jgi:hypothetical protein
MVIIQGWIRSVKLVMSVVVKKQRSHEPSTVMNVKKRHSINHLQMDGIVKSVRGNHNE